MSEKTMRARSTILPYWGACGLAIGSFWGGVVGYLVGNYFELGERATLSLMGSIICCFGIGGAVLGTARDVMRFFRDSFLPPQWPDADYGELPPFPTVTPSKSTHP
jgi:hypothetical protein